MEVTWRMEIEAAEGKARRPLGLRSPEMRLARDKGGGRVKLHEVVEDRFGFFAIALELSIC